MSKFLGNKGFSAVEMLTVVGITGIAAAMFATSQTAQNKIAAARTQSDTVFQEFVTSDSCDALLGGQSTTAPITLNDPSIAGSQISAKPGFTGGSIVVDSFNPAGAGVIGNGQLVLNRPDVTRSIAFRIFAILDGTGNIQRCSIMKNEAESITACTDVANGQIGTDGQCYVGVPNIGAAATPSVIGQYAVAISALTWSNYHVAEEQQRNMAAMANAMEAALLTLQNEAAISPVGQNAISVARQSIANARQALPIKNASNILNAQLMNGLNGLMGVYYGLGAPRIPDLVSISSINSPNIMPMSQATQTVSEGEQSLESAAQSVSSTSTESVGGGGGSYVVGGGG